jgi:metal-responsive CopG/Arc/MetJ family transcriptional regulator
MVYISNMPVTPVQISIDTELLRRIDADPEVREKGRSAFIRAAVRLYLAAKERRELEARLVSAYDGEADAMLAEVADLIGAQEWPES